MISVLVEYDNKHKTRLIKISGHSGYDEEGKDIVCAAASAIFIGGLNAISNPDLFKISYDKGFGSIESIGELSESDCIVLNTMVIQLKTIEETYASFIKIKEEGGI